MKVVIVNCFDTYEDRVDLVHEFYKDQGFDVTVIQSDFRHFKKVHREETKEGFIFVKSNPYYKNLSIARLSSHYKYASNAFKIVEDIKPDLLYTFVPPNSLAQFAANYKRKHNTVKLILDLIDLWPETMPIGKAKKFPPFTFWGAMRDRSLKYADLVITECNLYQSVLGNALKGVKAETMYLAKKEINVISNPNLSKEEIHLAYLGSINNIIDIQKIKEIIEVINKMKPVTLHIIGDGESKQELIDAAKSAGATVEYHGKVYDPQEKQDIFDICHFGLNIMKDTVCVGLTMKSIDYFQAGLPILNNIQADTYDLVEGFNIGINVTDNNIEDVASKVINLDTSELLAMRDNTKSVFDSMFSEQAFRKKLVEIFNKL
ncbi:glycosyltransferase family 4 protein [Bacillus sp. RO3]|nr:glycosyltransferase family 4 protein [Bacillus sp. RO3]